MMWPLNLLPWERMSRVEETFSASPNTVAMRSRVGKTENSRAWRVYRTVRMTSSAMTRLTAIRTSSRMAGSGMSIIMMTTMTPMATSTSLLCFQRLPATVRASAMGRPPSAAHAYTTASRRAPGARVSCGRPLILYTSARMIDIAS